MMARSRNIKYIRFRNHFLVQMVCNALHVIGEFLGTFFVFGSLIFIVKMIAALANIH